MELKKAAQIISALAEGVDPYKSEIFCSFDTTDTKRALYLALEGLGELQKNTQKKTAPPRYSGKTWSEEEDKKLISDFESGKGLNELSIIHKRTIYAIWSRLVEHGLVGE